MIYFTKRTCTVVFISMALSLSITMLKVTVYLNQPVNAGRNVCWHWLVNSYTTWRHFCTGKQWSKGYETESSHSGISTTLNTSSERGWGCKVSFKNTNWIIKLKRNILNFNQPANLEWKLPIHSCSICISFEFSHTRGKTSNKTHYHLHYI